MAKKDLKTLLDDLDQEMAKGHVYEASLRSDTEVVHGLQEGFDVFVDPRPAILETLWHELLHRRWPKKSEKAVTSLARSLIAQVDESTKIKCFKRYQREKQKRRPVDVDDE